METYMLYTNFSNTRSIGDGCVGTMLADSKCAARSEGSSFYNAGKTICVRQCDAERLDASEIPSWLDGTPLMVHVESRHIHRGATVIDLLSELLQVPAVWQDELTTEQDTDDDVEYLQDDNEQDFSDEIQSPKVIDTRNEDFQNFMCDQDHEEEEEGEADDNDASWDTLIPGGDPNKAASGKVSTEEILKVLKSRGLDVPQQTTPRDVEE